MFIRAAKARMAIVRRPGVFESRYKFTYELIQTLLRANADDICTTSTYVSVDKLFVYIAPLMDRLRPIAQAPLGTTTEFKYLIHCQDS